MIPSFSQVEAALRRGCEAYPKPGGYTPSYGTAGYRAEASLLPSTVYRCGVLMALRSLQLGRPVGICVTASHNPVADNGVKLVEPSGEMLAQAWEARADALALAATPDALVEAVRGLTSELPGPARDPAARASPPDTETAPLVLIAYDTRPSSVGLAEAARRGAAALGVPTSDLGPMTTPQLHWAVAQTARGLPAAPADYYAQLAGAFAELCGGSGSDLDVEGQATLPLLVDCANGIGAPALEALTSAVRASRAPLDVCAFNVGKGELNGGCGADFVQKARRLPAGFSQGPRGGAAVNGCSLDGDADRIVFWNPLGANLAAVRLLDGDRIAALCALLCADLGAGLTAPAPSLGVVQTAYANGASTAYITGHAAPAHTGDAVGDALSILLTVLLALQRRGWSLRDWEGLYADLPSRQRVCRVPDRTALRTADAERRAVAPPGLQDKIDEAVSTVSQGRAFVRPSGTEDVVRIYAEAATEAEAEALTSAIEGLIAEFLG
ncbi:hypothetical protein QBZ16_000371 [Prototheca wickerhamii]|uniref:phosphoacetylglucosamine mutase n=1 Tax=Prototheca wickerhamii TaxID=3111 RepID=A0AAD9IMP7_PROWI|nr:hypothetical protein QBZ16_000371 [Prototheca wickerhamii]